MKIWQMKRVEVDAKVLKMHLKVGDMFTATLHDQDGEEIFEQRGGYAPGFLPGYYGDYVFLDVDIDTGKILNWTPPTEQQLQKWINNEDAEQ